MKGKIFLKRVSKTLSLLLLIATLSLSATKLVEAGTWQQDAKGWWYQNDNNSYPRSSWQLIGGQWYYFNDTGYMATGWVNLGSSWYYLNPSGAMVTGWLNRGGSWYYLNPSGAMATGWLNLNDTWYHLQPSGAMSANCWEGNYYLEGNGAMAVNKWISQYYVGADGAWIAAYQLLDMMPIPTGNNAGKTWVAGHYATREVQKYRQVDNWVVPYSVWVISQTGEEFTDVKSCSAAVWEHILAGNTHYTTHLETRYRTTTDWVPNMVNIPKTETYTETETYWVNGYWK